MKNLAVQIQGTMKSTDNSNKNDDEEIFNKQRHQDTAVANKTKLCEENYKF